MTIPTLSERIATLEMQKSEIESALLKPNVSAFGLSTNWNASALQERLREINRELTVLQSQSAGVDTTFTGLHLY